MDPLASLAENWVQYSAINSRVSWDYLVYLDSPIPHLSQRSPLDVIRPQDLICMGMAIGLAYPSNHPILRRILCR